jgi:hypothetical protein
VCIKAHEHSGQHTIDHIHANRELHASFFHGPAQGDPLHQCKFQLHQHLDPEYPARSRNVSATHNDQHAHTRHASSS